MASLQPSDSNVDSVNPLLATAMGRTVSTRGSRKLPVKPDGERAKMRMARQKILEEEQRLEDLEALKMTEEQHLTLMLTFESVAFEFVDLDGLSWSTPEARRLLEQWYKNQVQALRANPSRETETLVGSGSGSSLSKYATPPPSPKANMFDFEDDEDDEALKTPLAPRVVSPSTVRRSPAKLPSGWQKRAHAAVAARRDTVRPKAPLPSMSTDGKTLQHPRVFSLPSKGTPSPLARKSTARAVSHGTAPVPDEHAALKSSKVEHKIPPRRVFSLPPKAVPPPMSRSITVRPRIASAGKPPCRLGDGASVRRKPGALPPRVVWRR
ncbi:hypothetical protein AcV7_006017 [Taiwanofungus camphoratus]|nr:hypothetical protein AcV7_006017 [Antrodia cinnamomea]